MCITFFYLPAEKSGQNFILSFNRDESFSKLTAPLAPFEEDPNILAGRDLEGKGTWCGTNKATGVVAFLTNFDSEFYHDITDIRFGRGNLTYRFLRTDFVSKIPNGDIDSSIFSEMQTILKDIKLYNAFNLVVGNLQSGVFYYIYHAYSKNLPSPESPIQLEAGQSYSLSNTLITGSWPKMNVGLEKFRKIIKNSIENNNSSIFQKTEFKDLEDLMLDTKMLNTQEPDQESSIFIPAYVSKISNRLRGTISTAYIEISSKGQGTFVEQFYAKKLQLEDQNNNSTQISQDIDNPKRSEIEFTVDFKPYMS